MPVLYATTAELKDRLGIEDTARDFALERCLEASSRWIERTLGRRFYVNGVDDPETRYFTADRCYWQVKVDDLLSVTEVASDANNDGVYETIWTAGTDFWLGPRNAPLKGEPYTTINRTWPTGRFSFPAWEYGVRVTSEAFGYSATTPAEIRELALMVAELQARPVLDMTMAGVQTYRLGTEMSVTMDVKKLPPMAETILDQYRIGGGYLY